jgi:hypothetical protein
MAGMAVRILGLGLIGPGLPSWSEARTTLTGEAAYRPAPSVVPPPQRLPPAERRRAGAAVKIALAVADAACSDAQADPRTLATVFASSSGDGANCHAMCETLASPKPADRLVSPTRFTNSVHNATAGYWHITVESHKASTSLCAHDDGFAAGMMAALTQLHALDAPLMLVASDCPYPQPLQATRPLPDTMGVALVLAPLAYSSGSLARARLSVDLLPLAQAGSQTTCHDAALEKLRRSIPAARALPLLEAIARSRPATVVLAASSQLALRIEVNFE